MVEILTIYVIFELRLEVKGKSLDKLSCSLEVQNDIFDGSLNELDGGFTSIQSFISREEKMECIREEFRKNE